MFDLNNLTGCQLITFTNIISINLAQNLNFEETAILAGFFTVIGDSLALLSLSKNCNNSLE